jgi:hypothetical protein
VCPVNMCVAIAARYSSPYKLFRESFPPARVDAARVDAARPQNFHVSARSSKPR